MIRKASKKEFLRALRDKSIVIRLPVKPDKIRVKNTYVVEDKDARLYFFYFDLGGKTAEMHVAAIKEHRFKARKLISDAIDFMKKIGYRVIITSAPEKFASTINMALNFGFKEFDRVFHQGYDCGMVYLKRVL